MKKWLLSKVNQVLTMCFSIMGLAGCMMTKYGTPYATLVAEGNVTNELAQPVEGVKVEVRDLFRVSGEELAIDFTDAEGNYRTPEQNIFSTDSIWIYATDETGEYAPDSAKVKITYDRTKRDGWYGGEGSAKADFVLKKK